MRGKFLRLLVLITVGFAAPIQGVLAATAGLCAVQSHDTGCDHGAEGGGASPVHDDGQLPQHAHCAPCVACCAAVAIAASARPVFQPAPASAPEILVMPVPAGVQPDALDRPPLRG